MRASFDSQTLKRLSAAIACISIVGVGLSLMLPLLALRLEAAGYPARYNGLHTAVSGLATLIGAHLTPWLARKFGIRRLLFTAIGFGVASLMAFAFCANYDLWLAIRIFFGLSLTILFVVSEYWISAAAPPDQRGMVLGVYATVLAIGFAIGPALLSLTGPEGLTPFFISAGLFLAAMIPVALAGEDGAVKMDATGLPNLKLLIAGAPIALGAALLYGAIETGGNALLPVFGVRAGFSPSWATFQLTLFALGNVVFPIPIGLIADRVNRVRLMAFFALFGMAGALFLPAMTGNHWLYAAGLFVWGGVVGGLYPVGLAMLGDKYQGKQLGGANAAYIMMYATGMMIGPPALGLGLDLASPRGLFDTLALFFALYLALILGLNWTRRRSFA